MAHTPTAHSPADPASAAPSGLFTDALAGARRGRLPATVGVAGAGIGLVALSPFLAPASVPMSVLGVVLARRSGDGVALGLGGLGVVLAMSALFQSGMAWLFLVAFAGAL